MAATAKWGLWEKVMFDLGYDVSNMNWPRQEWVHNNEVIYKGKLGRFRLKLFHRSIFVRFQCMIDMKSELIYLNMKVIREEEEWDELLSVCQAVADPSMAPLLVGIKWAEEMMEILLLGGRGE